MVLNNARLRLGLVLGVGLTCLFVLLVQFRYQVKQRIVHPRPSPDSRSTISGSNRSKVVDVISRINKPTSDLGGAQPLSGLKDRHLGRNKQNAKKKTISRNIGLTTVHNDTVVVHRYKEIDLVSVGRQGSTKVKVQGEDLIHRTTKNFGRKDLLKETRPFHNVSITDGDGHEQENGEPDECLSISTPDAKELETCGNWIRTCQRECMCGQGDQTAQIPKIVHFIKDENLTFSDWLAIVAAKKYIKPFEINLFTREDTDPNCWMRRLHEIDHLRVIKLSSQQWLEHLNNVTVSYVEHQSDLLRNAILYHYGGIYMDTDAIATKSFDTLLSNYSIILGRNLVNRIGNGLIVARRRSCLICHYASQACDNFDGSWTKHSTVSLSNLVEMNSTNYNLLVLNYTSGFFPFSWKEIHFHQLFDINSTQVEFSPTQVYALHLFGSKFSEEIADRFNDLNWINESPSVLATHVRTFINSQLLNSNHLNETLCVKLPPTLLS